jgi:hypothetical protein
MQGTPLASSWLKASGQGQIGSSNLWLTKILCCLSWCNAKFDKVSLLVARRTLLLKVAVVVVAAAAAAVVIAVVTVVVDVPWPR